jgi:hypothetical protein
LYLALEAAQSILEGFPLLKSHFCQTETPPDRPDGPNSYYKDLTSSQVEGR